MTQTGSPYDNAIAEKVNGILKAEFDLYASNVGIDNTRKKIAESIKTYNQLRPHASCDYLTPEQAHLIDGPLKKDGKIKSHMNGKNNLYNSTTITKFVCITDNKLNQ
ncbi:MAG: hypothetical protein EOO85_31220 [Pedobacter sp.]|nr:MAG: hypothetical protein EOO85_31220 [Pedobacter sp.]